MSTAVRSLVCFHMAVSISMSSENSPIPPGLNALRACKLCKLIKSYDQVGCSFAVPMIVPSQRLRELRGYSAHGWRRREGAGNDVSLF